MRQTGGGKTLKQNQHHSVRKRTARATGKRALRDLSTFYQGLSGFQASIVGLGDYKTTYGEVAEAGILALSDAFQKFAPLPTLPPDRRHFYDLGCGIGRIVIGLAILHPELRAHGVEIVPERVRSAHTALSRIKTRQLGARIQIDQGSFMDPKYNYKNAAWVFLSNLCFDEATQKKLLDKLEREMETGSVIICSKELPLDDKSPFARVASGLVVPMTWSSQSTCNVYKRK
jgi:hypothetical protein